MLRLRAHYISRKNITCNDQTAMWETSGGPSVLDMADGGLTSPHISSVNTEHITAVGTEFNINYMNLLPKGDCAEIELSVEKSHTSAFIYLKPQHQPVVSVKYGTRRSRRSAHGHVICNCSYLHIIHKSSDRQ